MYEKFTPFIALVFVSSCQTDKNMPIYQSKAFTLYADKVVQGTNEAQAVSTTHIKSTYKSPASESFSHKEWQLATDVSNRPKYTSEQPIVDALFNLSLEEATKNIEKDSTFRTGAKWGGVWTRDISYSILLAFAYHQPDVAKISLMKKVKRDRIIQDTGSGGAWPVSSDRTTWATHRQNLCLE